MDFSQFTQLVPFVACFAILYFIVLRPQQQKIKKHREVLSALKKGDHVILGRRYRRYSGGSSGK